MSKLTGPSPHSNIASKTAFAALDVDSGEDTEEELTDQDSPSAQDRFVFEFVVFCCKNVENGLCSAPELNRPTKSSIKKAAKLARTERKKRQKLEAREKVKVVSSDEPRTLDDPVTLLEKTTGQDEDRLPSEFLEIPRPVPPVTYVPAEVPAAASSDLTAVTETALNGVPHPPPPEFLVKDNPDPRTGTVDVISTVKQVPEPQSATNVASSSNKNSPSEADKVKKRQNVLNRVVWSLVMIGGFIGVFPVSTSRRYCKTFPRPLASWTCIHDSTRHAVSGTCL